MHPLKRSKNVCVCYGTHPCAHTHTHRTFFLYKNQFVFRKRPSHGFRVHVSFISGPWCAFKQSE